MTGQVVINTHWKTNFAFAQHTHEEFTYWVYLHVTEPLSLDQKNQKDQKKEKEEAQRRHSVIQVRALSFML